MADGSTTKSTGISFVFNKKKESSLKEAAIKDDVVTIEEKEYVDSIDENFKHRKKTEEKPELVIPLISNRWRNATVPDDLDNDMKTEDKKLVTERRVESSGNEVTDQAIQELLQDAARGDGQKDEKSSLSIAMQNRPPGTGLLTDKLDLTLHPDQATSEDYDAVPVEAYGLALLRGMGWKEDKSNDRVKPIESVLRPKGLGLGADKSTYLQARQRDGGKKTEVEEESLVMKRGAYCVVEHGRHQGAYAEVESLDEENARVFVRLSVSGDHVTLSQFAVRLVTKEDYQKNHKYINKHKVEKYKNGEIDTSPDHRQRKKKKHDRHEENTSRDRDRHKDGYEDKDRHKDRYEDKDRHKDRYEVSDRHKDRYEDSDKHKERHKKKKRRKDKMRDSEEDEAYNSRQESDRGSSLSHRLTDEGTASKKLKQQERSSSSWLAPFLRVRIVDKSYKGGKYFKQKVVVEDVISADSCLCRTDDGRVLDGLNQDQLETVIPKSDQAQVMIVSGQYKSQVCAVLQRDRASGTAVVQPLTEDSLLLTLPYEKICEYTDSPY